MLSGIVQRLYTRPVQLFGNDISDPIKNDIHAYLKENRIRLRNEMGITADYRKMSGTGGPDFEVDCEIREGKLLLMKLTLSVPNEEQARIISGRWQSASQEVYSTVMHTLLQDE